MSTKRTHLKAVYLTADERRLIWMALGVVAQELAPEKITASEARGLAKDYTRERLTRVRNMFAEPISTDAAMARVEKQHG